MGDDQEFKKRILANTTLFGSLPSPDIDQLAHMATWRRTEQGRTIFSKGDPGNTLFVVVSGVVKIATVSVGGTERVLNILAPGQMFGEVAMLDGGDRTADAVAMEAVELIAIERRDLFEFMDKNPRGWTTMLAACCDRIRWVSEMLEDTTFLELPARLAKRLLLLAHTFGEPGENGEVSINLRLSQQDLANLMSVTRESVSKVLNSWDKQSVIRRKRSHITLLSLDALKRILEADQA